jgi:hypothetical protein
MAVSWSRAQDDTPPVVVDHDGVRLDLLDLRAIEERVALDVLAAVDEGQASRALVGVDDDLDLQ